MFRAGRKITHPHETPNLHDPAICLVEILMPRQCVWAIKLFEMSCENIVIVPARRENGNHLPETQDALEGPGMFLNARALASRFKVALATKTETATRTAITPVSCIVNMLDRGRC